MTIKVAIMCALPEELDAIKNAFEFSTLMQVNGHSDLWHVKANDIEFIIGISNIGCINASVMASKICLLFVPQIVVLCGIAGSICPSLNVGDVVIPNKAFYAESISHQAFAENWAAPNPDICIDTSYIICEKQVVTGVTVATSDVFPAPIKSLAACQAINAKIIDMETYPAAFVAKKFGVPFFCVRSVSNSIDSAEIPENALSLSAANAALVTKQIVPQIVMQLVSGKLC